MNIGRNARFQGVREASGRGLDPSGKKMNIEHCTIAHVDSEFEPSSQSVERFGC